MNDDRNDVLSEEIKRDSAESNSESLNKVGLCKTLIGSVPGGDEVDARESRDERLGKL